MFFKRIHKLLCLSLVMAGLSGFLPPPVPAGAEEDKKPGGAEFLEGRRLQQLGEWATSVERFRAAADVYSIVADYALYQMAQSAFQVGDTESAASALEELLNLYPDTPVRRVARLELANLYCDTGEPARATPLIESVLPGAKSSRSMRGSSGFCTVARELWQKGTELQGTRTNRIGQS